MALISGPKKFLGKNIDPDKIQKTQELPIPLLRDWNLFEALTTNPFFGTKFKIWKKSGINKISKYFFRLGLTLKEANESWFFLKPSKKKLLEDLIENESFLFGINFKKFDSFTKVYFEKKFYHEINIYEISACDFLLSLESLSDYKLFDLLKKNKPQFFWNVYNSLENFRNLRTGIKIMQKIQKFVSKLSRIIISNKIYISEEQVIYVHIKNFKNLNVTYLMIKNLALYLMFALEADSKKEKIVIMLVSSKLETFVIGCFPKKNHKNEVKKKKKIKESLLKLGSRFDDQETFLLQTGYLDQKKFYKLFRKNNE